MSWHWLMEECGKKFKVVLTIMRCRSGNLITESSPTRPASFSRHRLMIIQRCVEPYHMVSLTVVFAIWSLA